MSVWDAWDEAMTMPVSSQPEQVRDGDIQEEEELGASDVYPDCGASVESAGSEVRESCRTGCRTALEPEAGGASLIVRNAPFCGRHLALDVVEVFFEAF